MHQSFIEFLNLNHDTIFDDVKALVARQSPSLDKNSVDICGTFIINLVKKRLNVEGERFARENVGDHLLFKVGNGNHKTLILGHFDTVWDLDRLNTKIEDGKFYGPGAYDMKAGLVQAIWATKALQNNGNLEDHQIWLLFTSDEEISSSQSRELIEETAAQCQQVLVLEPSEEGTGNLKIGRKGVGVFHVTVHGKASHAGNNPLAGISAAEEMAHQILRINALQDMARQTSVNVGIANAGSRINVIPEFASIDIDVRVATMEEAKRIENEIYALKPTRDGIKLSISGGLNRPPMEPNDTNQKLFRLAQQCARKLGFEVGGSCVGGGSDGNFTAALGIPTLDGLGPVGGGAHATYEHINIADLVTRSALVCEIIRQSC